MASKDAPQSTTRFPLIGNRLCVDFANTAYIRDRPGDGLRSWEELMDFLVATETIPPAQGHQLRELVANEPEATGAAFRAAVELRDALRRIVEAMATRRDVASAWVEPVNRLLRWTEGYEQLIPAGADGKEWRIGFVAREQRLEWLLAAIARSAAQLIEEGQQAPVRKCAHPACVLFFYDTSRTGRRRWCSMALCGNRSKVAAHARRTATKRQRTL